MEEMTKVPRVENVLTPLLNRAADLSDAALALVDSHLPDGMIFATMPQGTIFRLHVAGTATYRSGLVCLRSPETSVGAFSLLRGLLEAWSHVAFIFDPREGGDPRCRALRFERGSMNEWSNSVRVPPAGFDHATWQRSHGEKEQEIERMWQSFGCGTAHPRTRKHVDQTLKALAKEPTMDWITGVWRSTSATVHMYGADFAFDSQGDSHSELVWALPRFRATWLAFLVAAYSYLTTTSVAVLVAGHIPDEAHRFHEEMRTLIEDEAIKRMLSGYYDKDG